MNTFNLSADQGKGAESLWNRTRKLHVETVLKAVVDRISNGVDIAARTDITARQARDALSSLGHIRLWADWPVAFSQLEIAVISRGIRASMLDEPMSPACVRPAKIQHRDPWLHS
jgi:hypothetical protein